MRLLGINIELPLWLVRLQLLSGLLAGPTLADPASSMALYPVLALSGRASDPEHIVNPTEPDPVDSSFASVSDPDADAFASADPEVEGVGGSDAPVFASEFALGDEPSETISDFQDTLIRSEQDSMTRTFVSEDGRRLPESWSVPPGGSASGGHPGTVYEAPGLDYANGNGTAYFPPPEIDTPYRGNAYAYPGGYSYPGAYHPGGPYAFEYGGLDPMGDPRWFEDSGFDFDTRIPFVSQRFVPDQAHLKAGPFYFQALWVGTGVLYSDYNGPAVFQPGQEPGWLSYVNLGFRLAGRITPSLYVTAQGQVIYLFRDNELGFRAGTSGAPLASIDYRTGWGAWDIHAFADFRTGNMLNMFNEEAIERAGRYSFGFAGRYDNGLVYDPFLYTRVGLEASTLATTDWRLTLAADRTDFFYVGNDRRDDDHAARNHAGVLLGAEPARIRFTPWASYDFYSLDSIDNIYHTFYTGGSGRLSENVVADGRAGYFLSSNDLNGRESWLWNIGLRHRITDRTSHGVRFGQDFFMNDFTVDTVVGDFFRYYIAHEFSDRLRLQAFAQWSSGEYLSGEFDGGEFESRLYGINLYYDISRRLRASLGYLEENRTSTKNDLQYDRSVFQARLDARLGERSTGYLLYQHTDNRFFYEDLYMVGLRRYF
jgi:hypothetical protein